MPGLTAQRTKERLGCPEDLFRGYIRAFQGGGAEDSESEGSEVRSEGQACDSRPEKKNTHIKNHTHIYIIYISYISKYLLNIVMIYIYIY